VERYKIPEIKTDIIYPFTAKPAFSTQYTFGNRLIFANQ